MQPIQPAVPGQPLRASDLNAQTAEVRRQGNVYFEGGTLSQESGGVQLSAEQPGSFYAMITSRDGYNYGYKEVIKSSPQRGWNENETAESNTKPLRKSQGTGNYAIEINGSLVVPLGTIVLLSPLTNYYDSDSVCHVVYGFSFSNYGGDAVNQDVVVNVAASPSGILLTKHTWSSYGSDFTFSPTLMGCTDVIPKSLAGQKNKVLCVNNAETGFEFGASVAEYSGTSSFLAATTALQTSINNLTTQLNALSARLTIVETRLANIEAQL